MTNERQTVSTNAPTSERHHVVVIGSGFGGLFATQALKNADVDVTLVAKTTQHLFQPLLYQVATGILSEGEIAPSTREVLNRPGERHGGAGRGHRHRPRGAHGHRQAAGPGHRYRPTTA